jgi:UDP-N-acetyl-D-galactosamine dehydrogenase
MCFNIQVKSCVNLIKQSQKKIMSIQLPSDSCTVCILGLGYIGLPLATAIVQNTQHKVIGFDINHTRLNQLKSGIDVTDSMAEQAILDFAANSYLTNDPTAIASAHVFIVTVPTPIDDHNVPDLNPLLKASESIRQAIESSVICSSKKTKRIIIFESTVFPGATENCCLPILERSGMLKLGRDFELGYSPERLSPGLNAKPLEEIAKVVSATDYGTSQWLAQFYGSFIKAEVHIAPNIMTAEAAKITENIQRDVNIALMNELSIVYSQMGIDIHDVLAAASTKWNFMPFRPGLVGGHCIGVDPYYLIYEAQRVGQDTRLINSARIVNNNMTGWIARKITKEYNRKGYGIVNESRLLLLGATFKEDCPDTRNSKALLLAKLLHEYGFDVTISDHNVKHCDVQKLESEPYSIKQYPTGKYHCIVFAVGHKEFRENWIDILDCHSLNNANYKTMVVDMINIISKERADLRF